SDLLLLFLDCPGDPRALPSFPTRRSSDLTLAGLLDHGIAGVGVGEAKQEAGFLHLLLQLDGFRQVKGGGLFTHHMKTLGQGHGRSEEHTSELQSRENLVCRLLLEKKKK